MFFSDKELGKKVPNTEEISIEVFNGIISVFNRYKKFFSYSFPEFCYDNSSIICGIDEEVLKMELHSLIPELPELQFVRNATTLNEVFEEIPLKLNSYPILDFLEFCYEKIDDIVDGEYHSYFKHHHLKLLETSYNKIKFKDEINRIFERNQISFYINNSGKIERHLPTELEEILKGMIIKTEDLRLNELINTSAFLIKSAKLLERTHAIEKIWDAFERMKTYFSTQKKLSVTQLINKVSNGDSNLESLLNNEFITLTKIGNDFQIRHFESDKFQIKDNKILDDLFYRMLALIDLCISKLNKS